MSIEREIYLYEEKMLVLQYDMSELITHKLTRGEIREDYIKNYIKKKIRGINIEKGQIMTSEKLLDFQLDFIVCNPNGNIHEMGSHVLVDAKDCTHIFEIKSKLKTEYIKEWNIKAKKIKELNSKIVVGFMCYQNEITERCLLKKFGFLYDKEIDTYYNTLEIDASVLNIDYLIIIGNNGGLIIIRDEDRYSYYKEQPIIKYFIDLLKGNI